VRNDIEYDVNIKAELEIRDLQNKVDQLQELMLQHLSQMNSHLETTIKYQTGSSNAVKPE